jgi:hypothetical protein
MYSTRDLKLQGDVDVPVKEHGWARSRVAAISVLIAVDALFLMTWVLPIAQQPHYSHARFDGYFIVFVFLEIVAVALVYRVKMKADDASPLMLLVTSVSVVLAGTVVAIVIEGLLSYLIWSLWHRIVHS